MVKPWSAFLALLAVSACGTVDPGVMDAGSSEDSTAGSASSTTQPGSGPGSGPSSGDAGTLDGGSTTGDGTTGDGTTGDEDTTDGGPLSVCEPQPTDVGYTLTLDEEPEFQVAIDLDVACTVTSVASPGGTHSISLDCEDAAHVLDVLDLGPIDLAAGDAVELRVHDFQEWSRHTHVLLLRDGQVIVAGSSSSALPSGPGSEEEPPGDFFDPLGIEVVPDVCDAEPLPDEECNEFICRPPCVQVQRQALRFTSGGRSADVYDGTLGSVDGLQVAVGMAHNHVQVLCVDTPNAWYRFVAMRGL